MAFMPFSFIALPAMRVSMLCSNGASKVLLLASELAASISLAASCRANAGVGRTKQWDEPRVLAVLVHLVHELNVELINAPTVGPIRISP